MAFSHHDTAHGDEGSCGKAPFFSTQETSDGDISSCSDLTISLNNNTTSKVIEHKSLVSFGKTQFPGETSIFDTGPSRCTGAPVMTGNEDVIGFGLGHTGSNDTNANLRHEFD